MSQIKEVIIFSNGDSSEIATWSNIPYFFTTTLERKGITVHRVNLAPSPVLSRLFNRAILPLIKRLYNGTSYDYFRSRIHFTDVRRRIKKAITRHAGADAHIFLTFSFSSAGMTERPVILFCDWTYDHYFRYFLHREPDKLEAASVQREDEQINGSDLIISLFPAVTEYMKQRYSNEKVHYLGNVINSLLPVTAEETAALKSGSCDLLFVGRTQYIEGAKALVTAFTSLKQRFPGLRLNIIGMKAADFSASAGEGADQLPEGVICHGYLDKGKQTDRDLYYSIFKRSKVFVNTTPEWGAFSATIEAMYFSIPVIVTPYEDFVQTFGQDIEFGAYCEQNLPALIEEKVSFVLEHPDYNRLSRSAHEAVRDFTWYSYIDKLLKQIDTGTLKLKYCRSE